MLESGKNNQDDDFSGGHSPLMHMSSENKNQQQQQPQRINGARLPQGYSLKDDDSKESGQIFSHSQQQTLFTSSQGYPAKDDSPTSHESSCPEIKQQQSSAKISTSQEQSSKGDYLTSTQNTYTSPQQHLLAGATSLQEQHSEDDSSYDIRHLLPSGTVHSPSKDNYPQPNNQSSDPPIAAPPPTINHPPESNRSSPRSHQQPSPITSCNQQDSTNDYDQHKSQSSSIKDPSTQGHAAPRIPEKHESVNPKTVTQQKDEISTEKVNTSIVKSSRKNIRVPRKQPKSSSCCSSSCCLCSIL